MNGLRYYSARFLIMRICKRKSGKYWTKVKKGGDRAVKKFTKEFDEVSVKKLLVTDKELKKAKEQITEELTDAIVIAKDNIERFHTGQLMSTEFIETMQGVKCWRKSVAIEKVGLYIPGGTAPLFSTVLMLGIPAKLAGCKEIVLCTPPQKNGEIHPAILFAAQAVGINKIYQSWRGAGHCSDGLRNRNYSPGI